MYYAIWDKENNAYLNEGFNSEARTELRVAILKSLENRGFSISNFKNITLEELVYELNLKIETCPGAFPDSIPRIDLD
jgi:hypothetical protein